MHYYPFHLSDYAAATAHLSDLEDLAYRRLLDLYYDNEGPLPINSQWLAKRVRLKIRPVETVLNEFFTRTENGWEHERCEDVLSKYRQTCEKNKKNAASRWNHTDATGIPLASESHATGIPLASHSVCDGNASAMPTNNQEPITTIADDSSGHGFKENIKKITEVEAESHERGRVAQAMPENEQEPVPWPDDDDPPPEHPYTSREADPENPHSSRLPPRREVGPRPPDDATFPLKHVSGHYGKVLARLEAQAAEREAKRKAQGGAE